MRQCQASFAGQPPAALGVGDNAKADLIYGRIQSMFPDRTTFLRFASAAKRAGRIDKTEEILDGSRNHLGADIVGKLERLIRGSSQ